MNFETLKRYYESGMWNRKMLENAVKKKFLTQKEYALITCEVMEKPEDGDAGGDSVKSD